MSKRILVTVIASLISMAATPVFACTGIYACAPGTKICLQSGVTDNADTLHFVDTMVLEGHTVTNLPSDPQLIIDNKTSNVILRKQGQSDLVIGKIAQPVGEDYDCALARPMVMYPQFSLNVAITAGKPQTLCQRNALGLYERPTYNTRDYSVSFLEQNQTIGTINATKLIGNPISDNPFLRLIPCRH